MRAHVPCLSQLLRIANANHGKLHVAQVQVFHDLLGLYDGKMPRFAKRFAALGGANGPIAQARARPPRRSARIRSPCRRLA